MRLLKPIKAFWKEMSASAISFESIYDVGLVLNKWKNYYNDQRLHGSLGNKIPQQTWDNYFENKQGKMPQNRLTNIELLSDFKELRQFIEY